MMLFRNAMLAIIAVSCFVGAVFLYLLWAVKSPVDVVAPSSGPAGSYTIEALALNISILQIVLGLVGFLVAVLGFFGYSGIKEAAINSARKEARKTVSEQMRLSDISRHAAGASGLSEYAGDYTLGDAPTEFAEPAKETE